MKNVLFVSFTAFAVCVFTACSESESGEKYPGPCVVEADSGADGTVDRIETYTYDDHGNELTENIDDGADGTVDSRKSYIYSYDGSGNIITKEEDLGSDGTVDIRTTYIYEAGRKM